MGKDSYDLYHVQIHPNGNTNKIEDIRRDSIVNGSSKKPTSEYISQMIDSID
jgi:hypothetical protein